MSTLPLGAPPPVPTAALLDAARTIFDEAGLPALALYTRIACLSPAFDRSWQEHGHLGEAAELLRQWCAGRSLPDATVEVVQLERRTPVLLLEVPATDPSRDESTTLLYGHFDKQPALGEWREGLDPFVPVRIGDRLYGRGTADDGYATFAVVAGVEALVRTGTPHGRLVLLVESSEESGSPDLEAYLDVLAPRIGLPSLVICLDSGCVTYDRLWVTTSLRGNLVCTLRVDVLEEGVHSGLAGGIVPSSFRILRQLISRLEDGETGEILLSSLRAEIPGHRLQEIDEVAREYGDAAAGTFPTLAGLELSGSDAADRIERGTWQPALSVTGIDGMPRLGDAGNLLRPFTAVKLSLRLPPSCDPTIAMHDVEAVLTRDPPSGSRVRVEWEAPAAGWDAPRMAPWLVAAVEEASGAYFGASARSIGLGGSIPFMASLGIRYPGIQFLATGVLGPESNAHGPNEFLHVPTAHAIAAVVAHVLARAP